MDNLWLKLVEQAPNTFVNLLIAWFFLSYMSKRDQTHAQTIKDLEEGCRESHERISSKSTDAIVRNTVALDRNSEALGYASKNGR